MDKLNTLLLSNCIKIDTIDCLKPKDYFDITCIKVSNLFDFSEIFKDKLHTAATCLWTLMELELDKKYN